MLRILLITMLFNVLLISVNLRNPAKAAGIDCFDLVLSNTEKILAKIVPSGRAYDCAPSKSPEQPINNSNEMPAKDHLEQRISALIKDIFHLLMDAFGLVDEDEGMESSRTQTPAIHDIDGFYGTSEQTELESSELLIAFVLEKKDELLNTNARIADRTNTRYSNYLGHLHGNQGEIDLQLEGSNVCGSCFMSFVAKLECKLDVDIRFESYHQGERGAFETQEQAAHAPSAPQTVSEAARDNRPQYLSLHRPQTLAGSCVIHP